MFNYFQYSSYLLPKVFRAKFRQILMGGSRETGVFPRVQIFIQSQFFDLLRMRCI